MCNIVTEKNDIEILRFKHFYKHIVFIKDKKIRNKVLKDPINVEEIFPEKPINLEFK